MNPETKTLTLDTTDPKIAAAVEGLTPGDTLTVVTNDETGCVLEVETKDEEAAEPAAADTTEGEMPPAVSAMIKQKRTA